MRTISQKGDVVMKWFSLIYQPPMRMCGFHGFCYATRNGGGGCEKDL
jgi:hypothetical protein